MAPSELISAWEQAYLAFKGAFDNPVARRKLDDEFAEDARSRLRDLDELMQKLKSALPAAQENRIDEASLINEHMDLVRSYAVEFETSVDDSADAAWSAVRLSAKALLRSTGPKPSCWCTTCRPITLDDMRFVVCPECGNKRCPKATSHLNACTNSNAPGQPGSSWANHTKADSEQVSLSKIDADFWLASRSQIIEAARQAGFLIISNAQGFRMVKRADLDQA